MRAFENSKQNNGRSTTSCGYCRQRGHSIGTCPHIQYDYDEWSAFRVPHQSTTINHCRWFMNDYSYWIKQIDRYYPKFLAAQERKKNPTTRPRTAPKCGFCGDPNHNRRNCSELVSFGKRLKQANSNWRQAVFDKLVIEMGLGIGAVVKVQKSTNYYYGSNREKPEELVAIIDGFDLSKCNMFCVNSSIDSDYRQGIEVTVTGDGGQTRLAFPDPLNARQPLQDNKGRGALVTTNSYYYNSNKYVSTVARSEQPLDESWVSTGAMEDEFNWLLKKRSLEWLDDNGVVSQVETWEGERIEVNY
jgi:hypothetical protein